MWGGEEGVKAEFGAEERRWCKKEHSEEKIGKGKGLVSGEELGAKTVVIFGKKR